ncbi:MAG: DUF192 domain-containing protein [Solirubrobacterales bacterium]
MIAGNLAQRLDHLPRQRVLDREVALAIGLRARLLGLAWLRPEQVGTGLLIRRCASVHTFGMRFDLDVVFLDRCDQPLATHLAVPPRRLLGQRGAHSVLELPAGLGGEFGPPGT